MKYALELSYEGNHFSGWQLQPDSITVQEVLEEALTVLEGAPVKVSGAGRTDSGVHARGQVASFELSKTWDPYRLTLAVNANLPEHVSVMRASAVPDDFDARRSALWREYAYFVWHGPSCFPHVRDMVWWRKRDDWDMDAVDGCCRALVGEHDFGAFCRLSECPENAVRTLFSVRHIRRGRLSIFRIRGKGFLTNMVRIILGNIDAVATGKKRLEWFERLLLGGTRVDSATTAPASGLFFWRVGYDDF
ncbi:tRNA pseudouridine synthase A [Dethiosulfovibrio peptidovorans DSM 11002]|uniref:tRNA pseudouridine synthase A n=1 Tax=Dethiosulfovibrio peptidovorans DSM 11002 TaxID=469381 RepID=D2Z945_9BACT|nr:tRNA pseudouridine(38-40) synthase TruA [Dethiosulfovibrio peptidovorans]EFC91992.1 tRNA pseudouridine synthase A [Dethiosulfovibrio peptidovorans DSM 11002]